MINITAKDVSKLRTMTGAPMMDCKLALVKAKGDFDVADEILRKKGKQISDKKADRETKNGLVGVRIIQAENVIKAVIVPVYCETDFVARNEEFQQFVSDNLDVCPEKLDATDVIAKVGENIRIGDAHCISADIKGLTVVAKYVHNKVTEDMGTIGVVLVVRGPGDTSIEEANKFVELAHQIAMHVAAMKPKAISSDMLDQDFIERERRIFTEQARESGKPEKIIEKMVEGRLRKSLREVCLVNQQFVVDQEKTVGEVLDEYGAEVIASVRVAIGE